ncbi:MAG: YabP/YqfC family sporulation protein [Lachnospiraceae bacterium]
MKPNIKSFKTNLTDTLELPEDIILGASIVTLTGNFKAHIENIQGIIEYTDTKIKILTKENRMEIRGTRLFVDAYCQEEMLIKGNIEEVRFTLRSQTE